jgi:hypothetical protein
MKITTKQQNTVNIGHTQNNGAVLIVFTIKTAPLFCVCPVQVNSYSKFTAFGYLNA